MLLKYFRKIIFIFRKGKRTYCQVCLESIELAEKAQEDLNLTNFTPKNSKTGITKPISISILDSTNLKDSIKQDLEKNLLIKNLPKTMNGREFYNMVRVFGNVKLCKLVTDFYGNSKGYGYVYYMDTKSAEESLKILSQKEVNGKKLIVCNLIPGKTKENKKNNIHIKNLPELFTVDNLKDLFKNFGEIKNAGVSKGFGFIGFTTFESASSAYKTMKDQKLTFEGKEYPLNIYYFNKNEESSTSQTLPKLENLNVFARLRDDLKFIANEEQFRNEIKNVFKLFLYDENYSPLRITIKMDIRTALITMNSKKDLDTLLDKYNDFCNYYLPRVILNYYKNNQESTSPNKIANSFNQINDVELKNFKIFSLVDSKPKPFKNENSYENNKNIQTSQKKYNNYYINNGVSKKIYQNQNHNNSYHREYFNNFEGQRNAAKNPFYKDKDSKDLKFIENLVSTETFVNNSKSHSFSENGTIEEAASLINEFAEKKYKE